VLPVVPSVPALILNPGTEGENSDARASAVRSGPDPGGSVIPEAAELVKAGFVVVVTVFLVVSGVFVACGTRSRGSRRSALSAARTNGLEAGEDGAILTLAGAGRG
jgi:hypothetical protein